MRRLHRPFERATRERLPRPLRVGRRRGGDDNRGARHERQAPSGSACLHRSRRVPMRLLHAGTGDVRRCSHPRRTCEVGGGNSRMDERQSLPVLVLSPNRLCGRGGGDAREGGLMDAFAYGRAADIEDALAEGGAPSTIFLAGATELLNWLRLGVVKPTRVIDLTQLKGLADIVRLPGGGLRIG